MSAARTSCFVLLLALLVVPLFAAADVFEEPVVWTSLQPDLERASVFIPVTFLTFARVDLFRSQLSRFEVRLVRAGEFQQTALTARELCEKVRGTVCINAHFFDEQRRPLGLIVTRGNFLQRVHRGGDTLTGILQRTRDSLSIISRDLFVPGKVLEAVQAGPRILSEGSPVEGLREPKIPTRRSGVCITKERSLIFFTVSAGLVGAPFSDIQRLLLHSDIRCVDALNLDGGSSTQLYFSGNPVARTEPFEVIGEEPVPSVLALVPTDPS